ncbi:hypothetical protein KCG44_12020 [Pacificimonas sp. WHA3]|uniref:Uncharacterized protein n=1 Tax=Pacificimonas pallii TaxID=2827236 RepID=A0ABS6SGH4_9SPHN|nr:hypothetical protein [Pacificimonas pallii]MBV7257512.1 hypothetical protein [Pacificimonas pallii]
MTVCVSVKVHDCLIFAADSASSLVGSASNGDPVVLNVYDHGNKVFNLYKGKPIVAMTCGMGHMGYASIGNLAKDFRRMITKGVNGDKIDPENYTIKEVVTRAHAFFSEKYVQIDPSPASPHGFEFWIGGYGANCDNAEIWKLVISDGEVYDPELIADESQSGHVSWGGQPKPIQRLILGYDAELADGLVEAGIPEGTVQPLLAQVGQRLLTPLVHAAMPVQDAIALADFLVDLTKRYFAFLPGADIVGGDTDIATVTKHEGFKWIRRKHYYDAHLNPTETDHA